MKSNILVFISLVSLAIASCFQSAVAQEDSQKDKWILQAGVAYNYINCLKISELDEHQLQFEGYAGRSLWGDLLEVGVGHKISFNPLSAMGLLLGLPVVIPLSIALPPDARLEEYKFFQNNYYTGGYIGVNLLRLSGRKIDKRLLLSPTIGVSKTKYSVFSSAEMKTYKADINDLAVGLRLSFDQVITEKMRIGMNSTYLHYRGNNSISLAATISLCL